MTYPKSKKTQLLQLMVMLGLITLPALSFATSTVNHADFLIELQKNTNNIHSLLLKHKLAPSLQKYSHQTITDLKGTIEIRAALYLTSTSQKEEIIQYLLKTDDGKIHHLHIVGEIPGDLKTGNRVILKHAIALKINDQFDEIIVASDELRVTNKITALPDAFGPRRTITFLVNFQNQPTNQPWTKNTVNNMVYNTVNNQYYESSYNQTTVVGNAIGWFTLPINSTTDCNTLVNSIPSLAQQAATNNGVDLSSYTHRVYIFPNTSSCGWAGLGTIGRSGAYSNAWINGYNDLRVIAHELGHNLGLWHSNRLQCTTTGTCSAIEYGDYSDTMGWGNGTHFNAFQKERLGWLNYNVSPTITTVTTTGTYTIAPFEVRGNTPETNVKALKILKGTQSNGSKDYYYLEFRQPIGFDTPLGSCGTSCDFTRGVLIHQGNNINGNSSYILDPTPNTTNPALIALLPGQSFTDPNAPNGGITITTNSVSANGANVSIRFGNEPPPCIRAQSTMAITPNGLQTVKRGESRDYVVTITNKDSASCSPSQYRLFTSTTSPLMTATLNTTAITLNPGETTNQPLKVSIAANAYPYNFYFGVLANNVAIPTNYAFVTGGFTVTA